MKSTLATLVAALSLIGTAQADSYTLTFDPATACSSCVNGAPLLQSYGDVAGVVDISYIDVNNTSNSLLWWDTSYNDLLGVAWASGSDANSHGRIEIKSLNGQAVTLNSMDFGAWVNTTRGTSIRVTAIGGATPLFSYDGDVGSGATHTAFTPTITASGGLQIDWYNSAYNVGIDNVKFTVAVPEPESYAMLLAGLGLLGCVARRRVASKR